MYRLGWQRRSLCCKSGLSSKSKSTRLQLPKKSSCGGRRQMRLGRAVRRGSRLCLHRFRFWWRRFKQWKRFSLLKCRYRKHQVALLLKELCRLWRIKGTLKSFCAQNAQFNRCWREWKTTTPSRFKSSNPNSTLTNWTSPPTSKYVNLIATPSPLYSMLMRRTRRWSTRTFLSCTCQRSTR